MELNKEEKIKQLEEQFDTLLDIMKKTMMDKADAAYSAAPESFQEPDKDNFLLAKSIFDSVCQDRPCRPLVHHAEFKNIHMSI